MVALVTGLEAGVVVEDEDGRAVSVNDALIDMFALDDTREDIAGRPVGEVMEAVSARLEDRDGFLEEAGRVGVDRVEWVREWPLADGRTVEIDSAPIVADDRNLGRLWAFRDITARVAAEARREGMMRMEKEARRRRRSRTNA